MYNESVKREFLKTKGDSASSYESLFEKVSKYEELLQSDICTLSASDIQLIIDDIVGLRSSSSTRLYFLKDYVRWCINNGIPGACDGIMSVNQLGISKILSQMVSGPKHMQQYMDALFVPEASCTVDCIYRCYLWLAFSGMSEEEIMCVKTTDVDFNDMVVRYNDMEYPIYKEAFIAFKVCAESRIFVWINPNGKDSIHTRVPGDILLRGYRATPSYKTIRSELSKHAKNAIASQRTKQSISYFRAWLSGVFYRMYEAELQGMPVDFNQTAQMHMEGKEFALNNRLTLNGVRNKISQAYLIDYKRWKSAYHADK